MTTVPLPAPARYFPVREAPLRMEPGLRRLGEDLGNGERDRLFFQVDRERQRALAEKRRIGAGAALARDESAARAHARVLAWMAETLRREHPSLFRRARLDSLEAVAPEVQEDFAVVERGADGAGRATAVCVSFPSGWRPERVLGASFAAIHRPVPGFAQVPAAAASMVRAMVERGPYLRFVWTVVPDAELDRHPDRLRAVPWERAERGWLRVERQVSVPFPEVGAALFLIRTYLYPFDELSARERRVLGIALASLAPEIRRYKRLDEGAAKRAIALLNEAPRRRGGSSPAAPRGRA